MKTPFTISFQPLGNLQNYHDPNRETSEFRNTFFVFRGKFIHIVHAENQLRGNVVSRFSTSDKDRNEFFNVATKDFQKIELTTYGDTSVKIEHIHGFKPTPEFQKPITGIVVRHIMSPLEYARATLSKNDPVFSDKDQMDQYNRAFYKEYPDGIIFQAEHSVHHTDVIANLKTVKVEERFTLPNLELPKIAQRELPTFSVRSDLGNLSISSQSSSADENTALIAKESDVLSTSDNPPSYGVATGYTKIQEETEKLV